MQISVRLAALPILEYLDFHSGYSAPRSRIAGIYSRIYSYSRIFPNKRDLNYAQSKERVLFIPIVALEEFPGNSRCPGYIYLPQIIVPEEFSIFVVQLEVAGELRRLHHLPFMANRCTRRVSDSRSAIRSTPSEFYLKLGWH